MAGADFDVLASRVGPGRLLRGEADLLAYSYDGALDRARPDAVVLADDAPQVRRTVSWCAQRGVPFVARGAGTNLSGGCIPLRGGVVLSTARMNRVLGVDMAGGFAVVEPGVVNLRLQEELARGGAFYAPDPASYKVSTIGGNIAENAGGPRCLKYGVTTHHVLALEAVMPDGSLERFSLEDAGPEIVSLLVGSEGTLGVVTKAWVRILPLPLDVRTSLAAFPSVEAAVECVSEIIANGVAPRVLEVMDRVTIDAVEAFMRVGYPRTGSVLLVELDGPPEEVEHDASLVGELCLRHGASELRRARDLCERERLWEGRRGAYAAMARLAPNVLVEDGVVPRDRLPEIVRRIQSATARHGVTAGLLFHAGDGNIHPNIAYDERNAEQTARVKRAGHEILQACVELGGSLSGEHGIGVDKREAMAWLFTPRTLELFRRIRTVLDPGRLSNPDKLFPLADAPPSGPAFRRPASREMSPAARGLAERVRSCSAAGRKMAVCGRGTRRVPPDGPWERLSTAGLDHILDWDRRNYTVTVEAGIRLGPLHRELAEERFFLRLPDDPGTLGGLLAGKAWLQARDDLLGMRLLLADGGAVELGGKVVKNVAGYDVSRLLLGSWGTFGVILEATFRLHSRRPRMLPDPRLGRGDSPGPVPFRPNRWHVRLKEAFDPANLFNPWIFDGAGEATDRRA